VRAAVDDMRLRGVEFEDYDTTETRTDNGIARMPNGREGVVQRLRGQPHQRRTRLSQLTEEIPATHHAGSGPERPKRYGDGKEGVAASSPKRGLSRLSKEGSFGERAE
jgi:hypothetical protein